VENYAGQDTSCWEQKTTPEILRRLRQLTEERRGGLGAIRWLVRQLTDCPSAALPNGQSKIQAGSAGPALRTCGPPKRVIEDTSANHPPQRAGRATRFPAPWQAVQRSTRPTRRSPFPTRYSLFPTPCSSPRPLEQCRKPDPRFADLSSTDQVGESSVARPGDHGAHKGQLKERLSPGYQIRRVLAAGNQC
jgi:hypothetical protein